MAKANSKRQSGQRSWGNGDSKDLEGKKKYSWAHGRQGDSVIQGAGQLRQD